MVCNATTHPTGQYRLPKTFYIFHSQTNIFSMFVSRVDLVQFMICDNWNKLWLLFTNHVRFLMFILLHNTLNELGVIVELPFNNNFKLTYCQLQYIFSVFWKYLVNRYFCETQTLARRKCLTIRILNYMHWKILNYKARIG